MTAVLIPAAHHDRLAGEADATESASKELPDDTYANIQSPEQARQWMLSRIQIYSAWSPHRWIGDGWFTKVTAIEFLRA